MFSYLSIPEDTLYADQFLDRSRRHSFREDFVFAVLWVQAEAALFSLSVLMLPDLVQIIPEEDPDNSREKQAEQHQSHIDAAGRNRRLSMKKSEQSHIKKRAKMDSVLLHTVGLHEQSAQLGDAGGGEDKGRDSKDPGLHVLRVSGEIIRGTGRKLEGRLAKTMMRIIMPPPVVDLSNNEDNPSV